MNNPGALASRLTKWGVLAAGFAGWAAIETPFAERVELGKTSLILNGTGTRTATIFKVRVYDAALYLPERSTHAEQILKSTDPKRVTLRFLRNVDRAKLVGTWKESFQKACGDDCLTLESSFAKLMDAMQDAKTGELHTYSITQAGLEYRVNDETRAKIPAPALGKAVLATWIGSHPPSAE